MVNETSIPQPKTYGPLGNLPLLDRNAPSESLAKMFDEFGPIYRFSFFNRSTIMISGPDLVEEVNDETRFAKSIGHLQHVRTFGGDGLFTSLTHEANWQKAHNILIPAFSQPAMKGYHNMMVDIAMQLVQKWERLNPDDSIQVPDDMTRLTLDTIGLCGFSYRFNSYYRETPNPFIESMVRALNESMHKGNRIPIQDKLMIGTKRQFDRDIESMFSTVDKLIAERRARGDQGERDLLARMLSVEDPETGEKLDDDNIRYQIITFLIAGHETTSGLLSFALYFLLKHPDVLKKANAELDEVVQGVVPTYQDVLQLKYIRMILNESLRLWPTAPAYALYAKTNTTLNDRYPVNKGEMVLVNIPKLHRNQTAWGEDAEVFKPERFEDPSKVPTNAYKPFGNGMRACIGMQFALHEATLVLGMILQRFQLVDHTNYTLKVKQTLTLKPDNFSIRVKMRNGKKPDVMNANKAEKRTEHQTPEDQQQKGAILGLNARPLLILYGSDMGTTEHLVQAFADTARLYGVHTEVEPLNDRVGNLPKEGAVLIASSSYNGKPPSNARQFVEWLERLNAGELEGVQFSVFGCGDQNWASTYQNVPRKIDTLLVEKGATRFSTRGEGNMSDDFEKQFDDWKKQMWQDAKETFDLKFDESAVKTSNKLSIEWATDLKVSPLVESYHAVRGKVVENRELQLPGSGRRTRHLEIELPEGISYKEGDHLGVFPKNYEGTMNRVLIRFNLNATDPIIVRANGVSVSHLPLGQPVSVADLLRYSVELQEPATRAQIRELAVHTQCPPHKRELEDLLKEGMYEKLVLKKRVTLLDLIETYEACELPFETFLELLRPLKPRYYSISSSPRLQKNRVSVTVAVLESPAWSGHGDYFGVASHYLAQLDLDKEVHVFIRTPESGFKLPESPETSIVMVGPGTGLAPFRGFLQARSELKKEGQTLGVSHLYFGCRNENDYIYRNELEAYDKEGVVSLHTAFSRKSDSPKTYVQHLMAQNAEEVMTLLDQGAMLYLCGDGSQMAPDVERHLIKSYQKVFGTNERVAQEWFEALKQKGQYVKDVWSGS